MKKLLSILLILAMILGAGAMCFADEGVSNGDGGDMQTILIAPNPMAGDAPLVIAPNPMAGDAPLVIAPNPMAGDAPLDIAPNAAGNTYTVIKGDCLWKIAVKVYGDATKWPTIYDANKDIIKNPNLIYVDQIFVIPEI